MRFLHISDLHLGKTFPVSRYGQQFAHRRRQELLDTFSRLCQPESGGLHPLLRRLS